MKRIFFKINIVGIILLGICTHVNAQRSLPKWDNLVKDTETYKSDKAYSFYSDYLSLEPNSTRSSLYYRLGGHSINILESIDPIINADKFNTFAITTKGYYNKCLELLETADFKKDRDFFDIPTPNKRLTEAEVKAQVIPKIEGVDLFLKKTRDVQNSIQVLQENYISAYNNYMELTEKYVTESAIYASWDNDLEEKLNNTIISFKKVKESAEDYRTTLIKQPTKGYSANYTYNPIKKYRKDGLLVSNFTKGPLWDYGAWATEKLEYYNSKIKPIIKQANSKQVSLDRDIDNYQVIKNKTVIETDLYRQLFAIDPNNPVINDLRFKTNRLDFLMLSKSRLNSSEYSPTENLTTEKIDYIQGITKNFSELIVKKYPNDNDRIGDAIAYGKVLNNIKEYFLKTKTSTISSTSLKYKKVEIPLTYGNGFYRATTSGYLTKNIVPAPNGGIYISGSVVNEQGFAVAFTAYSNDEENITWLSTMDYATMMYDDCGMAIHAASDGNCYVLVSSKSVSDPSLTSHTVVGYNNKGEEILNLLLPEKILPLGRMIKYNPENKEFLLVFYGNGEDWFEDNAKAYVQKITTGNLLKYRVELPLNGNIVRMVDEGDDLILVGNSTYIQTNKKEYKTPLSAFCIYLKNGSIINESVFDRGVPCNIIDVFSTSKGLSILGQEVNNIGGVYKTVYTQLNNSGDLIFTNKLPNFEE